MTRRTERASELMRREVSQIVAKEVELQNALLTITRIDLSQDMRYADIYFTTIPDGEVEDALKVLGKNIFSIQQSLNKRLRMRPVPQIRFHIDRSEQEATKVDEILKQL